MAKKEKNKNQYNVPASKFGTIFIMSLLLISIAIFVYFTINYWKKTWWDSNDGDLLGIAKLIENIGSSSKSFLVYFVLPIGLGLLISAFIYPLNKGKTVNVLFVVMIALASISVLTTIALWIIWIIKVSNTIAFYMNLACCIAIISTPSFVVLMKGTCEKCGTFGCMVNTKNSSSKTYSTHNVSGRYETVSADIKDESGNKVGTLETQVYRPAYSYTSSKTTTTKIYVCKICGNVTETKSTS